MIFLFFATTYVGFAQETGPRDIKCRVSYVYANGDSLVFSNEKFESFKSPLVLPYKFNTLKFVFSSNIPLNQKPEYSIFLNKQQQNWNAWSQNPEAMFVNLHPGKYILGVRARTDVLHVSDGVFFSFIIEYPFYLKPYFIALYVLLLGAIVFVIIKLYRRQFETEKNNLNIILDTRTQDFVEDKTQFESQKETLNKALKDLKQLSSAGQQIIRSLSMREICNACYKELKNFLDFDNVGIGTYNAFHNSLDFSTFVYQGGKMPFARYNLDLVNNLNVWCYHNRKLIVIDDYKKQVYDYIDQSLYRIETSMFGSAVFVPLYDNINVIGVLNIQNNKNYYYTKYHLSIIRNIATYLEIAIVNYKFYTQIKKHKRIVQERSNLLEETIKKLRQAKSEEAKANKELQKLSIVVRNTDNAISIFDAEGNLEWVNRGFSKLYGFDFKEYVKNGKKYNQALRNPESIKYFDMVYSHSQSEIFSLPYSHKDGHLLWIQTTLTPIIDNDGKLLQVVAVDTDISALKQAENEIRTQRNEIIAKNKNLTESIEYAKTIQTALMPSLKEVKQVFPETFILNMPKDIVSGDFFWIYEKFGRKYFALCDCAGHGVPGAFVSMMGKMILDEIMHTAKIEDSPGKILRQLNDRLNTSVSSLSEKVGGIDGMDVVFCIINSRNTMLNYAGAYRPLYIVRNSDFIKIQPDRMSLGNITDNDVFFTDHEVPIMAGDMLYMTSDGYTDQFGHETGKKFGRKNFTNMLIKASLQPVDEQCKYIEQEHRQWRGPDIEQVDDIMLVGIRIIQNLN